MNQPNLTYFHFLWPMKIQMNSLRPKDPNMTQKMLFHLEHWIVDNTNTCAFRKNLWRRRHPSGSHAVSTHHSVVPRLKQNIFEVAYDDLISYAFSLDKAHSLARFNIFEHISVHGLRENFPRNGSS